MSSKLVFNSKLEMVRNKTRALTQQLKFASKARWSISYSSAKFYQKQQYVWSRLHVFSQLYRIIPAPIYCNNFIQILINFRFWENVCTLQKFLLFFWQENLMHSSVESSPSKGDASSLAPSLPANKLLDAFLVYKRQKVGNGGIWAVLQFWIKHVIHGFRCFSKVSLSLKLLSIHPCFWDTSLLNTI